MSHWAPFLLLAITAVLLVLPVTPALQELRKRHDANALPTSRHDGKITNFAESLQLRLEPCREELEKCRAKGEIRRARVHGMELLLVGHSGFDFDPEEMQSIDAMMVSDAAFIPPGRVIDADVWSSGDLHIGEGAVLRAALSSGNVVLAPNSAVLRWLHAQGNVYLRLGSAANNRLSADDSIVLEPGCIFQRMHAAVIFALASTPDQKGISSRDSSIRTVSQLISKTVARTTEQEHLFSPRQRMRVHGDFVLPAGESLCANVIATGEFRIERGASFFGSAKSYRNTVIEEGASVYGSIACGGAAHLGAGSFLTGPLMAENDVYVSGGSCIGQPDSLTTLAACTVRLAAGCRIHGTIWARVQGRVEG